MTNNQIVEAKGDFLTNPQLLNEPTEKVIKLMAFLLY